METNNTKIGQSQSVQVQKYSKSLEEMETLQDFQEFVDNTESVNCMMDFQQQYPEYNKKALELGYDGKIKYRHKSNYRKYYSLESMQKFIDDNNIIKPQDMMNRFKGMYKLCGILGYYDKLKYPARKYNWKAYNKLEDFQTYIDEHSDTIKTAADFYKNNLGLYKRMVKKGFAASVTYVNDLRPRMRLLQSMKTIEDYQRYIDEHKFLNISDFRHRNSESNAVYNKFQSAVGLSTSKLEFYGISENLSVGEKKMVELLDKKGIKYKVGHRFDWLVYKKAQHLDFFIPSLNLAFEIQGIQHFTPLNCFGGKKAFDEEMKRDRNKFDLCENHGIKVEYFALTSSGWIDGIGTEGYFATVYELTEENLEKILKKYTPFAPGTPSNP